MYLSLNNRTPEVGKSWKESRACGWKKKFPRLVFEVHQEMDGPELMQ
jgi:hypothetical protein